MDKKISIIISAILIFISFVASIIILPYLPDTLDTHWDAFGNVNGTMPKLQATLMVPALTLVIFLLLIFLPRIDPLKRNNKGLDKVYGSFILAFTIFMVYIHGLVIAWNMGYRLNISKSIIPAIAILFYYIGIILKDCKRNWFIGIRTPWTMESDEVWDQTHKVASVLFKVLAIITFVGLFFPNILLVFVPVILVILFLIFYSYFLYTAKQKRIYKHNKKIEKTLNREEKHDKESRKKHRIHSHDAHHHKEKRKRR